MTLGYLDRHGIDPDLLELVNADVVGYASSDCVWANIVKGRDTLRALLGVETPPTGPDGVAVRRRHGSAPGPSRVPTASLGAGLGLGTLHGRLSASRRAALLDQPARATKDELELTWAEFVVRGAGE